LQASDLKSDIKIWRGATQDGKAGHPTIFHADLFKEIRALKGDSGARSVVSKYAHLTKLVPLTNDHARLDLDTPEDWANWRARRQR